MLHVCHYTPCLGTYLASAVKKKSLPTFSNQDMFHGHIQVLRSSEKYVAPNVANFSEIGRNLAESTNVGLRFAIPKSSAYLVGSGEITTRHTLQFTKPTTFAMESERSEVVKGSVQL